jgi:hypothetical protein
VLRKIGIAGGLILLGVTFGIWISRPHQAKVDLGAAPTRYVPSGTLKVVDSSGVELATLGIDLMPSADSSLGINFYNGPDEFIGQYLRDESLTSLTVYAPLKDTAGPFGSIVFTIDPSGERRLTSKSPAMPEKVIVRTVAAYKPPRFSEQWWLELLFSRKQPETLQSKLPSEDSRLVHRDGKPFAVCGHDSYGIAAIVFVSSNYVPEAEIYFQPIQGNVASPTASPTFEVFDRNGHMVALLATDSLEGPQLSFSSADQTSNTGETLFDLDPTGTKLLDFKLGRKAGVVDWLAQPMYRARLPIRLVDAEGKVIWSSSRVP